MYVLQRGVTSAFVQEITFSPDQRLAAVVSAPKGTAHLFPIRYFFSHRTLFVFFKLTNLLLTLNLYSSPTLFFTTPCCIHHHSCSSPYGGYVDAHSHLQPPTRINFQQTLQNHHKRVPITPSKIGMLKRSSRTPALVSHSTSASSSSSGGPSHASDAPNIVPFGAAVKFEGRIGNEYSALVLDNSGTLYHLLCYTNTFD